MNSQEVQTVNSKLDLALVTLAVAALLAGVLGFSFLSEQALLTRVGVLLAGVVAGVVIAWFSQPGKRFIAFGREAYDEARRVVWPSRKETVNTTGIVFAFVVIMAVFLFIVDKALEWVLYDLLLRWK
ncbi:MAG TPA: preprotein translocase subunit SecE [Burkholderiaceae bacterium]|jgi:preprotein translocase subunit SecE|nr:preprotein translocase subunit SecE [Burkholderiaceae bacterium]